MHRSNKKKAAFIFTKDTSFAAGRYRFNTFYAGEGHAPDNIVLWFDKDKILYGGCLVKSKEAAVNLGNLSDANVKAWPGTIKKNMRRFPHPAFVIPGRQSWKSNQSLQHTLKLIRESKKMTRRDIRQCKMPVKKN